MTETAICVCSILIPILVYVIVTFLLRYFNRKK